MRTANMAEMIDRPKHGTLGEIVQKSVKGSKSANKDGRYVDSEVAIKLLRDGGFFVDIIPGKTATSAYVDIYTGVEYDDKGNVKRDLKVKDECKPPLPGTLVAAGFSGAGKQDALLHALLGAVREGR